MTNKWISDKEVQQRKAGCCSLKKKTRIFKAEMISLNGTF